MSAIPADLRIARPWGSALPAFVLLLAAILLLYRETALTMAGIWWRSETFAHCLLVLPISLWLVWRRRGMLAAITPRPQPWVLLPLLVLAVAWLLSDLVVVNAASQFALVGMIILAVPAVLGVEVALAILFPLLFLLFAVPFGEFMVPHMMEWTADFTVAALRLSGVPVFREGQQFVIPSGNWSVIDECSGVRYVMASFMVGSLFAYLNYSSAKRRAVMMVVALLLPVVANWLRAYMIVMLAHLSGNKLAVGVDHILYGWVFFGLIMFLMFMVGARWSQPDDPGVGSGVVVGRSSVPTVSTPSLRLVGTVIAATVVVLAPHLAVIALVRSEGVAAPARVELPVQLADGWSAAGAQIAEWQPEFGLPPASSTRAYSGPRGTVGIHLAYYRGQTGERKLVSSQNVLVGMRDPQWAVPIPASRSLTLAGQSLNVRTAELIARPGARLSGLSSLWVWRLYWIDGRYIGSDAGAKVAGIWERLQGRGDDGAELLLYTQAASAAGAAQVLEAFLQANHAPLNALLQRTRDTR